MYELVYYIMKEFKPFTTACKDGTGMTLNEPSKITEWWWQYFQNLLTGPNIIGTKITLELGEKLEKAIERREKQWNKNEPPTIDDDRKDTQRLKSDRLSGPDNITAQLLKIQLEIIEVTLHKIVCQIWKELFQQWEDGLIWPIHKKVD
jgi:hypothetical protein